MQQLLHSLVIDSPIGKLGIRTSGQHLTHVDFLSEKTALISPSDQFTDSIAQQFHQYFTSPKFKFSLPYLLTGSDFHQQVLKAVDTLPYGATFTYGELAQHLHTHPRAIGTACRRNPLPVVIPCHRIIAKGGDGGYAGHLTGEILEIKLWLLAHEASCLN